MKIVLGLHGYNKHVTDANYGGLDLKVIQGKIFHFENLFTKRYFRFIFSAIVLDTSIPINTNVKKLITKAN